MGRSVAAKKHLDKVSALGCILCRHLGLGESPAEIHHLFDRASKSDFLVAPLCPPHHRGATGFHGLGGEPGFAARYKLTEAKLLSLTLEALA